MGDMLKQSGIIEPLLALVRPDTPVSLNYGKKNYFKLQLFLEHIFEKHNMDII